MFWFSCWQQGKKALSYHPYDNFVSLKGHSAKLLEFGGANVFDIFFIQLVTLMDIESQCP